jgi:anti-sigma regulatory factor (Ser/Thr protein kinase)
MLHIVSTGEYVSECKRTTSVNPGPELTLRLPLARQSARVLRAALAEHLAGRGVPLSVARDVLLAADEAFINAFMHSGDVAGAVEVRAAVQRDRVLVTINDRGCGFETAAVDVRSVPDLMNAHGRGLFLIHHLMDEVEVHSRATGPGPRVSMMKSY